MTTRLRGVGFVRTWQLLVLLRTGKHTLYALALELGVTTRTIRRDLEVLEAAGLPVASIEGAPGCASLWFVGEIREWPRREPMPTEVLRTVGGDCAGR